MVSRLRGGSVSNWFVESSVVNGMQRGQVQLTMSCPTSQKKTKAFQPTSSGDRTGIMIQFLPSEFVSDLQRVYTRVGPRGWMMSKNSVQVAGDERSSGLPSLQ